jgi:phosphoglycerate dehydrogenase-like enzyme
MKVFRIALSGDYLDEEGKSAYGDLGWSRFAGVPYIQHHFLEEQSPRRDDPAYWQRFYSLEMMPEQIRGVNGLIVVRPWVKESLFRDGADDLVVIGRAGAGFDKIDLDACTAHHVAVFNAPRALDHATASSALMFLLVLAKKLPQQERITRQGRWDLQARVLGNELRGRTLGIIGLGHSGRELARLVAPFQMWLLAHSPHADPADAARLGVRLTDLDEVLRESDFVSVHTRLTLERRHILGADQLGRMRPGAYLINVARGELVDHGALVEALRSGKLAGAALDVFEHEPLPLDDPLLELDNVIVTPHWSASTADVWRDAATAMIAGMLRAAIGQVPDAVVNPAVLARKELQAKLARFAENTSVG